MLKKYFTKFLLVLNFNIILFTMGTPVLSEQVESNVTVKIVNDIAEIPESSNKDDPEKNKESKNKHKLPKTNEVINPYLLPLGVFYLVMGVVGVYINNKKNGENKNEKN